MNQTKKIVFGMLCVSALTAPAFAETDAPASLFVKVEEAKLRQTPSFLSPVTSSVKYGDKLQKVSTKDAWFEVATAGKKGFLHSSALTPKKIVFASNSNAQVSPDATDVVAAGKGFSAEVEKQYAATQRNADYAAVNRIEKYEAKEKDVIVFARDGGLLKNVK